MPKPRHYFNDGADLAPVLRDAIEKLAIATPPGTEADVVKLFQDCDAHPTAKGDAFWLLDERPGRFINYTGPNATGWHSLLRRTRNHPTHGPAMFATFRP